METTTKEIAAILRATDSMANAFAQRVQERVGQPVPFTDILAAMRQISSTTLTMDKVVARLRRQLS